MLRWRLILGAVFIATLVGLVLLDVWAADEMPLPPGLVLLPLALTITGAATREYVNLIRTREPAIAGGTLAFGNWIVVAAPWFGACTGRAGAEGRWQLAAYVVAVFLIVFREMVRYDQAVSRRSTERSALAVFGLTYVGLLMSFIVRLRLATGGILPLVMMLLVVKLADIGAYTVGRLCGKRKLAPKLSPGKTWEGLIGGLVFATAGGIVVYSLVTGAIASENPSDESVVPYLLFSVIVALAGVLGDLAESLLKRDFSVKDSSTWMPGFGGVLDLIDSPLMAAPVAWAFWEFGVLLSGV